MVDAAGQSLTQNSTATWTLDTSITVALGVNSAQVALTALTIDAGGRMDIGSGGVTVAGGGISMAAFREGLTAGRNGGTWDGPTGIVSSAAAAADLVGGGLYDNGFYLPVAASSDRRKPEA